MSDLREALTNIAAISACVVVVENPESHVKMLANINSVAVKALKDEAAIAAQPEAVERVFGGTALCGHAVMAAICERCNPPHAPDERMRRALVEARKYVWLDTNVPKTKTAMLAVIDEALSGAADGSNASAEAIHLFCQKDFVGAGGLPMTWKIECDALSDADLKTIAAVCAPSLPKFCEAVGVPRGGLRLAAAMNAYADPASKRVLIVDDVWTTGKSMTAVGASYADWIGFVAFARGPLPSHVSSFMALSPAGADEGKESEGERLHEQYDGNGRDRKNGGFCS